MALMHMKCIRRCWDSKRTMRYWPGDEDNIDTANPIAKHFLVVGPAKEKPKPMAVNLDPPELSASAKRRKKAKEDKAKEETDKSSRK